MLTTAQLRQLAARTGARDIGMVETDILLTHLLQRFHETGLVEHLAFKGGTMFRKMVFGPKGRFSTDLDFTCRTEVSRDDLTLMLLDALSAPYHGIDFRFDRDKDWYLTEDGCGASPTCSHTANERGIKIKIQVSTRERPLLPVVPITQLEQDYFRLLPFQPAPIPCLALEEAIAEKIRAASQRSKIRDLYDLAEFAGRPLNGRQIRSLAVLKLWNSGGLGLDYTQFKQRVEERTYYDVAELRNLFRRDHRPDLDKMIGQVVEGFRFLNDLTDLEKAVAADNSQRRRAEADFPLMNRSTSIHHDSRRSEIEPLCGTASGWSHARNRFGEIAFAFEADNSLASTTQVFKTGEIRGANHRLLRRGRLMRGDFLAVAPFERSLKQSLSFYVNAGLSHFGYAGEIDLELGLVNMAN